ncbi:MAG: hypothetical protein RI925_1092, partial [Pseudomonadota bacterium]
MFQNLKIGVRLAIGFGLLVCLLIAITALSYLRINQIDDSIEEVSKRNMPKVAQAHEAIDQVNVTARALRNALLVRSTDEAQKEFERVVVARREATELYAKLDKEITSAEGRKLF